MDEKKLNELWAFLKSHNATSREFGDFKSVAEKDKGVALYNYLKSEKYTDLDYPTFYRSYGGDFNEIISAEVKSAKERAKQKPPLEARKLEEEGMGELKAYENMPDRFSGKTLDIATPKVDAKTGEPLNFPARLNQERREAALTQLGGIRKVSESERQLPAEDLQEIVLREQNREELAQRQIMATRGLYKDGYILSQDKYPALKAADIPEKLDLTDPKQYEYGVKNSPIHGFRYNENMRLVEDPFAEKAEGYEDMIEYIRKKYEENGNPISFIAARDKIFANPTTFKETKAVYLRGNGLSEIDFAKNVHAKRMESDWFKREKKGIGEIKTDKQEEMERNGLSMKSIKWVTDSKTGERRAVESPREPTPEEIAEIERKTLMAADPFERVAKNSQKELAEKSLYLVQNVQSRYDSHFWNKGIPIVGSSTKPYFEKIQARANAGLLSESEVRALEILGDENSYTTDDPYKLDGKVTHILAFIANGETKHLEDFLFPNDEQYSRKNYNRLDLQRIAKMTGKSPAEVTDEDRKQFWFSQDKALQKLDTPLSLPSRLLAYDDPDVEATLARVRTMFNLETPAQIGEGIPNELVAQFPDEAERLYAYYQIQAGRYRQLTKELMESSISINKDDKQNQLNEVLNRNSVWQGFGTFAPLIGAADVTNPKVSEYYKVLNRINALAPMIREGKIGAAEGEAKDYSPARLLISSAESFLDLYEIPYEAAGRAKTAQNQYGALEGAGISPAQLETSNLQILKSRAKLGTLNNQEVWGNLVGGLSAIGVQIAAFRAVGGSRLGGLTKPLTMLDKGSRAGRYFLNTEGGLSVVGKVAQFGLNATMMGIEYEGAGLVGGEGQEMRNELRFSMGVGGYAGGAALKGIIGLIPKTAMGIGNLAARSTYLKKAFDNVEKLYGEKGRQLVESQVMRSLKAKGVDVPELMTKGRAMVANKTQEGVRELGEELEQDTDLNFQKEPLTEDWAGDKVDRGFFERVGSAINKTAEDVAYDEDIKDWSMDKFLSYAIPIMVGGGVLDGSGSGDIHKIQSWATTLYETFSGEKPSPVAIETLNQFSNYIAKHADVMPTNTTFTGNGVDFTLNGTQYSYDTKTGRAEAKSVTTATESKKADEVGAALMKSTLDAANNSNFEGLFGEAGKGIENKPILERKAEIEAIKKEILANRAYNEVDKSLSKRINAATEDELEAARANEIASIKETEGGFHSPNTDHIFETREQLENAINIHFDKRNIDAAIKADKAATETPASQEQEPIQDAAAEAVQEEPQIEEAEVEKRYPVESIFVRKIVADGENTDLTERQKGSLEKAVQMAINAGQSATEIMATLNALGFAFTNPMGASAATKSLQSYLEDRINGKTSRNINDFVQDTRGKESKTGEVEVSVGTNPKSQLEVGESVTPTENQAAKRHKDISEFSNEDESYRVIVGDEAFDDIVESGVVRTNADKKGKPSDGISLGNRPTAFPSFSKGKASIEYAASNPNNYIIVTNDKSIQPSKQGRHGKGTTMFPTDENGNHLRELDAKRVSVYKHVGDGKYELVYENGNLVEKKAETTEKPTIKDSLTVEKPVAPAAPPEQQPAPEKPKRRFDKLKEEKEKKERGKQQETRIIKDKDAFADFLFEMSNGTAEDRAKADHTAAVYEQAARVWAKKTGKTVQQWWDRIESITIGGEKPATPNAVDSTLQQANKEADKVVLIKDKEGNLLAPNGEKSNLNETQWRIVRTPSFKKWFGDWEKDPENASKVVDKNGEPMVVYHGTGAKRFSSFLPNSFFTDKKDIAESYSQQLQSDGSLEANLYPVFLNIRNPKNMPIFSLNSDKFSELKKARTDGVRLPMGNTGAFEYVAKNPNQIKMADGSNTAFNPNSDNILQQIIGEKGAARVSNAVQNMQNLAIAKEMQAAGKDAKTIWLATGWEYNKKEGKWKMEIADNEIINNKRLDRLSIFYHWLGDGKPKTLSDFLGKDSDILKAYPQIGKIELYVGRLAQRGVAGAFQSFGDGLSKIAIQATSDEDVLKGVLSHEIQHAIQDIEGFATGGSPDNIMKYEDFILKSQEEQKERIQKDIDTLIAEKESYKQSLESMRRGDSYYEERKRYYEKEIRNIGDKIRSLAFVKDSIKVGYFSDQEKYNAYRKLAGEVEARNVQTRLTMSDVERAQKTLSETEDVAEEDKIYLSNELGIGGNGLHQISMPKAVRNTFIATLMASSLAFLAPKIIYTPQNKPSTKEQRDVLQKIARIESLRNISADTTAILSRLLIVYETVGSPKINTDSSFYNILSAISGDTTITDDMLLVKDYRAYANPLTNSVNNISELTELIEELSHSIQFSRDYAYPLSQKIYKSKSDYDSLGYKDRGHIEHQAHSVISKYLEGYILYGITGDSLIDYTINENLKLGANSDNAEYIKEVLKKNKIDGKTFPSIGKVQQPPVPYETVLSKEETIEYEKWVVKLPKNLQNTDDYDLKGLWLNNPNMKPSANLHLPDDFKKPNHITFSEESVYSNSETEGGEWVEINGKWHFKASPFNLMQHSAAEMQDYFNRNEKDAVLEFPNTLQQGEKGTLEKTADDRFKLFLLNNRDVSTPLHELAHIFQNDLSSAEKTTVVKWINTTYGKDIKAKFGGKLFKPSQWVWESGKDAALTPESRAISEFFARGFEQYLKEGGKSKDAKMQSIFDKFAEWLKETYITAIQHLGFDIGLNDDMRALYDSMFEADKKFRGKVEKMTSPKTKTNKEKLKDNALSQSTDPLKAEEDTWVEIVNKLDKEEIEDENGLRDDLITLITDEGKVAGNDIKGLVDRILDRVYGREAKNPQPAQDAQPQVEKTNSDREIKEESFGRKVRDIYSDKMSDLFRERMLSESFAYEVRHNELSLKLGLQKVTQLMSDAVAATAKRWKDIKGIESVTESDIKNWLNDKRFMAEAISLALDNTVAELKEKVSLDSAEDRELINDRIMMAQMVTALADDHLNLISNDKILAGETEVLWQKAKAVVETLSKIGRGEGQSINLFRFMSPLSGAFNNRMLEYANDQITENLTTEERVNKAVIEAAIDTEAEIMRDAAKEGDQTIDKIVDAIENAKPTDVLIDEIIAREQILKDLMDEKAILEEALRTAVNERNTQTDKLAAAKKKLANKQAVIRNAKKTIQDLKAKIHTLEIQLKQGAKNEASLRTELGKAKSDLSSAQTQLNAAENENKKLLRSNDSLRKEIAALSEKVAKLEEKSKDNKGETTTNTEKEGSSVRKSKNESQKSIEKSASKIAKLKPKKSNALSQKDFMGLNVIVDIENLGYTNAEALEIGEEINKMIGDATNLVFDEGQKTYSIDFVRKVTDRVVQELTNAGADATLIQTIKTAFNRGDAAAEIREHIEKIARKEYQSIMRHRIMGILGNTDVSWKRKALKVELRTILKELVTQAVLNNESEFSYVGGLLAEVFGIDHLSHSDVLRAFNKLMAEEWQKQTDKKRADLIKQRLKTKAEKDEANERIKDKAHIERLEKLAAADEMPQLVEEMLKDARLYSGSPIQVKSRFSDKYGVPITTGADMLAIQAQLEVIAKTPNGALRTGEVLKLFNMYAKMMSISTVSRDNYMADSMFHTNNLSGIPTMLFNIKYSAANMAADMKDVIERAVVGFIQGKGIITIKSEWARIAAIFRSFVSKDLYSAAASPFAIQALRVVGEAMSVSQFIRRNIAEMDKEIRVGGDGAIAGFWNFLSRLYLGKFSEKGLNASGIISSILSSADLWFQILARNSQRAALLSRLGKNTPAGIVFVHRKDTPQIQFKYKGQTQSIQDILDSEVADNLYTYNSAMYYQRMRELHSEAVQQLYGIEDLAIDYGKEKLFKENPKGVFGAIHRLVVAGATKSNTLQDEDIMPFIDKLYRNTNPVSKAAIRMALFAIKTPLSIFRIFAYSKIGLNQMQRSMEFSALLQGLNIGFTLGMVQILGRDSMSQHQKERHYLELFGKDKDLQQNRRKSTIPHVNIGAQIADIENSRIYVAGQIKAVNDAYNARIQDYYDSEAAENAKANNDAAKLAEIANRYTKLRINAANMKQRKLDDLKRADDLLIEEETTKKAAYDQAVNEMWGRFLGNILRNGGVFAYLLTGDDDDDDDKVLSITSSKWDSQQIRTSGQIKINAFGYKESLSIDVTPYNADLYFLARWQDMVREDKILPEKEQSGTGKKLLSSVMAYRDVMWQIAAMRGMESLLQVATGTDSRSSYGKTLEEKGDDELAKLVQLLGLLQGLKVPSLVRGISKDIGYKGENITIDKEEAGNLWVALQFARGMGLMDIGLGRSYGYTDYVAPAVSIVDGKPLYSFQGGEKHAPLRHFEGILKRPDTDRDPYALTANSAERRYRIYEWIDKNGVQEALYKQSGQLYSQYRIPDIKGTTKLPLKPLAEIKTIVAGTGFNKLTEAIILDSFQITVGEETITGSQKELAIKVLEGALDTKNNKYSKIFEGDIEGAEKFAMQEAAKDIYSEVNKEVLAAFDAWVGENIGTQKVSPNKLSKGLKHLPKSK